MLITLHLCVLCGSQETITFALYIINILVFITEAEIVYCAVRPKSLYKTRFALKGLKFLDFCRNSYLHRLCVYDVRHLYTHFEYSPGSRTCDVSLSTPKALTHFLFSFMKYPPTVQ